MIPTVQLVTVVLVKVLLCALKRSMLLVLDETVSEVNVFPVEPPITYIHRLVFEEILLLANALLFAPSRFTPTALAVIVLLVIVLF